MDKVLINPLKAPGDKPAASFDSSTGLGLAVAFVLISIAIALGGNPAAFLNLPSFLLVVGGTIGATLVQFPTAVISKTLLVLRTAFWPDEIDFSARLQKIISLAARARSEGVLSLEAESRREPERFLRKCIQLIVDGIKPEDVARTLEIELAHLEDRHREGARVFQAMGAIAPAMGLIGTLVGLVQMLQNLNDPSQIGPGMAVALLTTFYGAILSYVIFLPIAGKLRSRSDEERTLKEMTLEGAICIIEDVNPRLIEQRLLSFVPPEQRFSRYE